MSDATKGRPKLTPLMQQYFEIRDQYPDTLLLVQAGDYYELFFDRIPWKSATTYAAMSYFREELQIKKVNEAGTNSKVE